MDVVNDLPIFKIVLILLQCTCYMKADCSTTNYKVFPREYNIFMQTGVEPFFKPMKVSDRNKCVQVCALETFCHIWRFENGNCHIFHSMKDKLRVETVIIPSATTYYETEQDDEWFKIYFLKTGSGFVAALSFLGVGTYESWGPAKCTKILCPDFFRSNLIDDWNNLPINKVKLLARKGNKDVVSMIFDGRASTKESWFSVPRVLASPWVDVQRGTFIMNPGPWGNFFMYITKQACPGGVGWFTLSIDKVHCKPNKNNQVSPFIRYSSKTNATRWANGYSSADDFSIFVSLK